VQSVAQIGNNLRVLAAPGEGVAARLQSALGGAGIQAEAMTVPANLEDVFVDVTRDDAAPAATRPAA
jgi:ABC-2 type transport system ATP-binding protein